jgi:UDP-galactopyranose mutase
LNKRKFSTLQFQSEYVVVGSGLTGATIARCLHDKGKSVLVLERRQRIGGNVADKWSTHAIRIHLYGPHLFRTCSDKVWEFVNRFSGFYTYKHIIKTQIDGELENWPVAASYIRKKVGGDWRPDFEGTPKNFKEAALSKMPRLVYEKFVKGYTEKQWGKPATELSPELCGRFSVHQDDDPHLNPDAKYQSLPLNGYTQMVRNMLHQIPVVLNFDYLKYRDRVHATKKLIYTGSIDEYFGFRLGRLEYRAQQRQHRFYPQAGLLQPCAQVNNPSNTGQLRTIEWKHLMPVSDAERITGTLLTEETPYTPQEPDAYEYPVPDAKNYDLYSRYVELAENKPVVFCGRLGSYQYLDMDGAIEKAMGVAKTLF